MQRRHFLTAAGMTLAAPGIVRAESARRLTFVPSGAGLAPLDTTWTPTRVTRIHASLVFDTLYGMDETLTPHPQMAEGHTTEQNGRLWTIRLRPGLKFHDGSPVLARDAVASIRRFSVRDGLSQSLMAVTDELTAPDDRTVRFRLAKPFPLLPAALAGSSFMLPVIMPERLASTEASRQISEMTGSGPYRFIKGEFNAGERAAYERFADYVPRAGEPLRYGAGGKIAHFDRVEWRTISDIATAVAALSRGEVDWIDSVPTDLVPQLSRDRDIKVEVTEPTGSIPLLRFNCLHPPFNNPLARRALLGTIDQSEVMQAVAGSDRSNWRDRVGLFSPGSGLANDEGIEALSGPRDRDRVRRDLAASGYDGRPVIVLTSFQPYFREAADVTADQLRKAGLNLDVQTMDFPTVLRRRESAEPPEKGGWNAYVALTDGAFIDNPVTNYQFRGDGTPLSSWLKSPELEGLRAAWLDAADEATQARLARQMQRQLWLDVPYIPLGSWVRATAHRRDIVDLPWGHAAFYGVRRA
jgi:peptide/nickel transport system substrate-binding protein